MIHSEFHKIRKMKMKLRIKSINIAKITKNKNSLHLLEIKLLTVTFALASNLPLPPVGGRSFL